MLDYAFVLWYYFQNQPHYMQFFIMQQMYYCNYNDSTSKFKVDIVVIPIMQDEDMIIQQLVKKLKMIVNLYYVGLNLIVAILLCLIFNLLIMLHQLKIAPRYKCHGDILLIGCDLCCYLGWTETTHEKRKRYDEDTLKKKQQTQEKYFFSMLLSLLRLMMKFLQPTALQMYNNRMIIYNKTDNLAVCALYLI